MKQFEEIRALLATQIKQERKRLRSFDTKKFDAFALAHALTPYVQALIAEGQWSTVHELRLFYKKRLKIMRSKEGIPPVADLIYRTRLRLKKLEMELCEKKDQGLTTAKEKERARPWKAQSSQPLKTKPTKK